MENTESNSKAQSVQKTPLPWPRGEFEKFMLLPTEIRIMIWRCALVAPRVLKLYRYNPSHHRQHHFPSLDVFCQQSTIPPLLHVCRESRWEALVFGGFKDWKCSQDFPLEWITPEDMMIRWLPFRPTIDLAFITTLYSQDSGMRRYGEFGIGTIITKWQLRRVVLPRSVAQDLLKYFDEENGSTGFQMDRVLEVFPKLEELTISFSDSLDEDSMNDYRLIGKATEWNRPAGQAPTTGTLNDNRQITVNIAPSVWEYLHLFL